MRTLLLASLLLSSVAGCAASSPEPAREPKPTLYNAPEDPGGPSQADVEQLRASQARYTSALAVAIRIGAAIFVTQRDKCPTVDEVVEARLVSVELHTDDAWGKPFRITCPPEGPRVTSAGPDGVFDTPDDLVSGK